MATDATHEEGHGREAADAEPAPTLADAWPIAASRRELLVRGHSPARGSRGAVARDDFGTRGRSPSAQRPDSASSASSGPPSPSVLPTPPAPARPPWGGGGGSRQQLLGGLSPRRAGSPPKLSAVVASGTTTIAAPKMSTLTTTHSHAAAMVAAAAARMQHEQDAIDSVAAEAAAHVAHDGWGARRSGVPASVVDDCGRRLPVCRAASVSATPSMRAIALGGSSRTALHLPDSYQLAPRSSSYVPQQDRDAPCFPHMLRASGSGLVPRTASPPVRVLSTARTATRGLSADAPPPSRGAATAPIAAAPGARARRRLGAAAETSDSGAAVRSPSGLGPTLLLARIDAPHSLTGLLSVRPATHTGTRQGVVDEGGGGPLSSPASRTAGRPLPLQGSLTASGYDRQHVAGGGGPAARHRSISPDGADARLPHVQDSTSSCCSSSGARRPVPYSAADAPILSPRWHPGHEAHGHDGPFHAPPPASPGRRDAPEAADAQHAVQPRDAHGRASAPTEPAEGAAPNAARGAGGQHLPALVPYSLRRLVYSDWLEEAPLVDRLAPAGEDAHAAGNYAVLRRAPRTHNGQPMYFKPAHHKPLLGGDVLHVL